MKNNKIKNKGDYKQLKLKIALRFWGISGIALLIIVFVYSFFWKGVGGDFLVGMFEYLFKMEHEEALILYHNIFRVNKDILFGTAVLILFLLLLRFLYNWLIKYFRIINDGINELANEKDGDIHLPSELSTLETKLNQVKNTLKMRDLTAKTAEQKKNDLVMYLAHDIRTPLTSVIGYLNLLEEAPDMPPEQRAKYVHITLDKAYRLEKMVNEFFEITRYNMQQIQLTKENFDLAFMLIQLTDELTPILVSNGNTAILQADDNLLVYGDPNKLARVFNNILKNAAAYSYSDTDIFISVKKEDNSVVISFTNRGQTIPKEKLNSIFEKFYRLDESRNSNDGGTGLGLAVAKEIITLHNGTIAVESRNETTVFTITLPIK